MSDFEDSTVMYTTVSSPYEGRSGDVSPGVDGPPVMPEDPYAYVVAAFQALPPPDYVPVLEEPEQAPPSPVYIPYVSDPVYPEYIPPEDDVFPAKEQPLPAAASPTAESPGYIHESDPDEDPEEDPADYPADHDDDDEEEEPFEDDADEEDEEQDENDDDEEEEEHPALADFIPHPPALRVTARISFRPHSPTLSFTKEDVERFLAMPIPPPSPLTPLSSLLPQIPSPPLPASPPILPIQLPAASPPLQLLSFDRREDRPKVTLPPRKRLSIVHCPRYEAGKSSVAAAARPIEEDIGYGIRDTWIDLRDVAEEEALTTLEGVNTRVTELAAVQEQDTQDIYRVMEDTQGRQTEIFQRVEALVDDSQYHYETGRLALPSSDYVPGLEEPEQAPPSHVYIPYVPELEYPEYIPPEDEVFPAEEQPLPTAASPTTNSPGYIPDSDSDEDPEDDDDEDPEEDPADYPADYDDDEEEEHSASADSIPPPPALPMPIPSPSPLTPLSSSLPQIPYPPLPASPHILPIPLHAASPPLQLLSSDRRADRPEVTLPPRKRLSIVHCLGYEAGESSAAAAARPIEGRRVDYGFVGSVEAEIRRRRAEDIRYGIRDTWIDLRDVAEEEALTTLEGVNTRVTKLAAVQEQDTQDIYGVIKDTQGRQTEIFQRVEALVDDSQYHYETGRLADQEAIVSREAWAHSIGLSSAVHFELQGYMTHTWVQDQRIDAQDTLIAILTTQLSSLQGHLATALGEIRALQTREQARTGAPEDAGSST
nr:hypothetical protein [Tanacetum cinerariifolium]